jgi:bifunctional lysine-specific demethylase and histidyl-hydroxylase NO66
VTRYPALDRCIGAGAEFLAEYWGRQPLLRPGQASDAFADLLTLADVDDLVTSAGLRVPELRLVQDGAPVPVSSYTTAPQISGVLLTGLADPRRVLAAIDDGATLVLQGMHRYRGELRRLCRGLEVELGCPCQVNAYFTPPGARGLALHSDTHDVFVLQCFGRKRWEIHAPDGVWDVVLEPGDALYMPKGTPHAATAQHELSGHLTIGLVADSIRGVLARIVDRALSDDRFDARLPAGWQDDPGKLAEMISVELGELTGRLDKIDAGEIAADRTERFYTRRPSSLSGALIDLTRLPALDLAARVRRRKDAVLSLQPDGDRVALRLGDRAVRMPAWVEPSVRFLADGADHVVGDIPGLDPDGRLVLARRLVREGLLEVRG